MAGGNRSHLKKSQRNQNKIHGLAEVLETRRLLSHPAFFGSTIYPAGSFASAMVAADFNGDGKADLATANPTENSVSVLLNKGNGTFAAKTNYATSQSPSSVVAADLNGDGRIDLAVTNADSNTVSVLLNRGRGRFGLKTDYVTAARPVAVAATDLNGDGRVELIVANETDQNIQIFYNAGSGKFVKVGDYKVDGSPAFLAATDLNGDGRSDLAISVRSYDNGEKYFVRVLLNKGNGAFIPADYTSDTRPGAIFAADLDGSGKKDLVVETAYGELDVFINKGNGTFSPSLAYPSNVRMDDEPRIAVADFNGDGKADILANSQLDSYYDGAALLVNRGDGTFSQPIEYALGIPSFSRLAAADFNGDGRIDLASTTGASDYGPPEIQIHLNAGVSLFAVKTDYEGDLTRPGAVFAGDFDGNGRMDLLASTYVVGSQLFCFNADGTSSFTQLGNGSVIAVADLNADKKPDLIVSDGNLGVQLNNGDGTFGPTTFYLPGPQYYVPGIDVAIADFNGDGAPDIAASAYGTNVVQILRNNGYGSFVLAEQYAGAGSLVASDFNRDGRTDLIVSTDTGVQVLINKGSGLFAAGASYAIGSGAMITTDLNNDGLLDVVVSTDNGVVLLRGNGRGKFSVKNILPAAGNYGSIAAADFNGDGRTDLAVTGAVFLNRGNAQFAPGISFATGARSNFIITADFNGDGKPDLAWSNLYGNSVSVMLNGLD